jgi:ribosomal protein S18 acetylase RimI-like enzyme
MDTDERMPVHAVASATAPMPSSGDAPVQAVPPAAWPALAPFIHRHNQRADGGLRCLHAAQGDGVAQLANELAALPADEAVFWQVSDAHGEIDGIVGCEFDAELGRAWLRGPIVAGDPAQRQPLQHRLLQALEAGLPRIRCFDAFPAEDEASLNALYAARGYQRLGVHRVLEAALCTPAPARAAAWPLPLGVSIRPAQADDLAPLLALHEALFPNGYLKASDFAEAIGDAARRMLVCTAAEGRLLGYLHAKDDPEQPEVYVDYLGVAPDARGQGLGAALLADALAWGRALARPRASLTVREDRAPALALYERSGFRQVSAGVHWRALAAPLNAGGGPPAGGAAGALQDF